MLWWFFIFSCDTTGTISGTVEQVVITKPGSMQWRAGAMRPVPMFIAPTYEVRLRFSDGSTQTLAKRGDFFDPSKWKVGTPVVKKTSTCGDDIAIQ